MPRRKTIKNILVEGIVFVGLLATLGHMTVNFWERFIIQSELAHMKTSLHSLKVTIANIGAAYDNLHKELQTIVEVAETKNYPTRFKNVDIIKPEGKPIPLMAIPQTLDRRKLHDMEVKAIVQKINRNLKTDIDVAMQAKTIENKHRTEDRKLKASINANNLNVTTATRYPLNSMGVGTNMKPIEYEARETCRINEPHTCRYAEYSYCRNQYKPPCYNWKV